MVYEEREKSMLFGLKIRRSAEPHDPQVEALSLPRHAEDFYPA